MEVCGGVWRCAYVEVCGGCDEHLLCVNVWVFEDVNEYVFECVFEYVNEYVFEYVNEYVLNM